MQNIAAAPGDLVGDVFGHRRMNIIAERSQLYRQALIVDHLNIGGPESLSGGLERDGLQLLVAGTTEGSNQPECQ